MSEYDIFTDKYQGHRITISYDDCAWFPREDDNLSTFIFFHRDGYGDTHDINGSYRDLNEIEGEIKRRRPVALCLPVSCYQHSGIVFRLGSPRQFPDSQWDAGYIGFAVVYVSDLQKEHHSRTITPAMKTLAEQVVRGELEAYSAFCNGWIYAYTVEDENGDVLESVGGFYDQDEALEEAEGIVDGIVAEQAEKHELALVAGL